MSKVDLIDRAALIADLRAQYAAVYKDTMLRPIMDGDPFVEVLAKSEELRIRRARMQRRSNSARTSIRFEGGVRYPHRGEEPKEE